MYSKWEICGSTGWRFVLSCSMSVFVFIDVVFNRVQSLCCRSMVFNLSLLSFNRSRSIVFNLRWRSVSCRSPVVVGVRSVGLRPPALLLLLIRTHSEGIWHSEGAWEASLTCSLFDPSEYFL